LDISFKVTETEAGGQLKWNPRTYVVKIHFCCNYEGWNFNSGNYLFTTDTK